MSARISMSVLLLLAAGCGTGGGSTAPTQGSVSTTTSTTTSTSTSTSTTTSTSASTVLLAVWRGSTSEIDVFDIGQRAQIATPDLTRPGDQLMPVAASRDGRYLLASHGQYSSTGAFSSQTVLYDLTAKARVALPGLAGEANDISSDGSLILTADDTAAPGGPHAFGLALYDRGSGGMLPLAGITQGWAETGSRMSGDGRIIAYNDTTGRVHAYDRTLGADVFVSGGAGRFPRPSADGSTVSYVDGYGVVRYDLVHRTNVALPGMPMWATTSLGMAMATTPDGRFAALGIHPPPSTGQCILVYDSQATSSPFQPVQGASTGCNPVSVALSGDGRYLAGQWEGATPTGRQGMWVVDTRAPAPGYVSIQGLYIEDSWSPVVFP